MLAFQGTDVVLKGKVRHIVYEVCQGVLMGDHGSSHNGSDSMLLVDFQKI
jgi:hypothetical protein